MTFQRSCWGRGVQDIYIYLQAEIQAMNKSDELQSLGTPWRGLLKHQQNLLNYHKTSPLCPSHTWHTVVLPVPVSPTSSTGSWCWRQRSSSV